MPTTFSLRRALAAAGLLVALAAPASPAGAATHRGLLPCVAGVTCQPAPAPGHGCPNADVMPNAENTHVIEHATLCLINHERVHYGRRKLHSNHTLRIVARHYAHKMVTQAFFAHVSPGGSTFDQRIRRAGYLHGANGWALGENLAWGAGTSATPRQIVLAWMHSPEHRRNLLDPAFHDAGLGVAAGLPVAGMSGATYVNEFGRR